MALSVFCLCAQWCDTCGQFQALFEQAARLHADDHFFWVDIETHEQYLEDLDIENFPTIVIASGATPHFFGTILPHLETLDRLCTAAKAGDLPAAQDPQLCRVTQALTRHCAEFRAA